VKNLDFSIVVCCYSGENTIERCLISLINQDYSKAKYEIIIVDDGSIDNSSDVIINYLNSIKKNKPSIKYYRTENHGLSCARNFGIHYSTGNYILFIDEDAEACEEWLSEYRKLIDCNNFPDVIYGITNPFNNSGNFEKYITYYFYHKVNANGDIMPYIIGTNMGFKYNLFKNGKGFLDDFSYRGDENAFLMSLNFSYTEAGSTEAIVQHKNPNNIQKWLKERIQNGLALFMVDYYKHNLLPNSKKYKIIHYQSRLIYYLFVLFGFLLFQLVDFVILILFFITAISIYAFKNSQINKRYYQMKKQNSSQPYNKLFTYIFLKILGTIFQEYGYFKSILFNNKKYSLNSSFSRDIISEKSY